MRSFFRRRTFAAGFFGALALLLEPASAQTAPEEASPVHLDPIVVYGRENTLMGGAETPAEGEVGAAELDLRPFLRRGELLEVVPGLIVTQHSGDGKANQYFLRGFNLDHGTDFATTVDGMPVNLPSNAHGQGYSDLNFIIPELVQSISYEKGTYTAANGDFSAAGAAQFHLVDVLDQGFAKVEFGQNDAYRFVAADSWRESAGAATTVGVEDGFSNGPWVNPEEANHQSLYARQTWGQGANPFSLTLLGYRAAWNSTDQVPARGIAAGIMSRFGAIDPSDGGTTSRTELDFDWIHRGPDGPTHLNFYALYYRLNLFSDFTYFLVDPVHGDQFNQRDRRGVFGGSGSHEWTAQVAGKTLVTTVGFQERTDVINLGFSHTEHRAVIAPVDLSSVHEEEGGVYAQSKLQVAEWFRLQGGLRADAAEFDVDDSIAANSGKRSAAILSPKLDLVFGPWARTEFYLDAGDGFHSNDARGTVERFDPPDGSAASPVTPLVRAEGAEVGSAHLPAPGVGQHRVGLGARSRFRADLRRRHRRDGRQRPDPPLRNRIRQFRSCHAVARARCRRRLHPCPLSGGDQRRFRPRQFDRDGRFRRSHGQLRPWLVREPARALFRPPADRRDREGFRTCLPHLQRPHRLAQRALGMHGRRPQSAQPSQRRHRLLLCVAPARGTGGGSERCPPPSGRAAGISGERPAEFLGGGHVLTPDKLAWCPHVTPSHD